MNEYKIAAAYIRVSTDDQLEYSPDSQLEKIRDYAAKNHYIVPDEYIFMEDEGRSGRKSANRSQFQAVIALAKSPGHPVDAILVWKFSRFARNQEEAILYKNRLKKLNVAVISISEPLPEGPFGSLIERIIEWEDEYYSINLAQEVRRGMTEKAKRGQLQTSVAFGYRKVPGENRIEPDPKEAPIVQEIFRRFLGGDNYLAISLWLNSSGFTTRRGKAFSVYSVRYIIQNPIYNGYFRWTPTKKVPYRTQHCEDTILSKGEHLPLIDSATWDAAKTRAELFRATHKKNARPAAERKHWLSGIVRCAACGSTLVFTAPHYIRCGYWGKGGCTSSQHIGIEILEAAILQRIRRDLEVDNLPYTAIRSSSADADALQTAARAVEALERKLSRLRDAYLAGVDTVEEYKAAKAAISAQLDDARAHLVELQATPQERTTTALKSQIAAALQIVDDTTATVAQKYEAMNAVIERCTWDKSTATIEIIYRAAI